MERGINAPANAHVNAADAERLCAGVRPLAAGDALFWHRREDKFSLARGEARDGLSDIVFSNNFAHDHSTSVVAITIFGTSAIGVVVIAGCILHSSSTASG